MNAAPEALVKVWDPVVRICHWALVASVTLAWLTHEGGGRWHEWFGYAALAVLAVRIPWGLFGPEHARFRSFLRSPRRTLEYALLLLARREPRHLGHNPLGGWMIVLLIANVLLASATGWLFITDRFWGAEWLEELHEALAQSLLFLIGLHVLGVIFTSIRQRENLIAAMIHGRKARAGKEDAS